MKLEDGSTIEVHLATAEFTRMLEVNMHKDDAIEVTGWKTEFEGVQTIFLPARSNTAATLSYSVRKTACRRGFFNCVLSPRQASGR
jgi:hypothetical protein